MSGKSAEKIYDRLITHNDNKDWWSKIIFFGREDGHLDKSQTDYLEKKLIEAFQKTDLTLDNATSGNTSFIEKTSKIKADNVWNIAQEILDEVAHINIFENYVAEEEDNQTAQIYIEPDKHKISGKSYRDNQKNFFLFLLKQPKYRSLVEDFCLNGKSTPTYCIGSEPSLRPNGMKYTTQLEENIHLYSHLSTKERHRAIQNFADATGLKVVFHWD